MHTLGAVEQMRVAVLFRHRLLGVEIGVGHLGGFASASHLDSHQKGDPERRNDGRNHIAVADGQEEPLRNRLFGSQKVVERRDGCGERRKRNAFRHDGRD